MVGFKDKVELICDDFRVICGNFLSLPTAHQERSEGRTRTPADKAIHNEFKHKRDAHDMSGDTIAK
jgi:hypothetical protein